MTVGGELRRLYWKVKFHQDFLSSQNAIFGYCATGNLGDDAALYSAQLLFKETELKLLTPQTYRRIPGNLKTLICGIGGFFHTDIIRHFDKYLKRIKKRSFPIILLSAGMNRDYNDRNYQDSFPLFKEIIAELDYVTARDPRTKRLLEELGANNVRLIPDLALSLPVDGTVDIEEQRSRKTVGLILATHNPTVSLNRKSIDDYLVAIVKALIANGYKVVCIPFQVDSYSDESKQINEIKEAQVLQQKINDPKFTVLDHMMPPLETLEYFRKNLSVVISMRLHGNVIASRAGVPFISLSYNDKHLGFLELMDMLSYDVPLSGDLSKTDKVLNLLAKIEKEYDPICAHINRMCQQLVLQTQQEIDLIKGRYSSLGKIR